MAAWICVAGFGQPQVLSAQDGGFNLPDIPVLTIEPDRLFADTAFGQRLSAEIEQRGALLAAENRKIEAELAEEEIRLTALRPTLTPERFRVLADDFDARVIGKRQEQDIKARAIGQLSDRAQRGFLQAIAPILERMMNEKGAGVVLDRRAVFLSIDATDITRPAVARINAALGDGLALDQILPADEQISDDSNAPSTPESADLTDD